MMFSLGAARCAHSQPMTPTPSPPPVSTPDFHQHPEDGNDPDAPGTACVLSFNANDPLAAGGLANDVSAMGSVGVHALTVVTGSYIRDSSAITDFYVFEEDMVEEQARTLLEDLSVQAIKIGFVGSTEALSTIAGIASDYEEVPVVAYMPDLSWWSMDKIERYLDAFAELVLPQTSVLVGNHSTLCRWLLPDWPGERSPTARDIALAASSFGAACTLVTGIPLPGQFIDNVLASPQSVIYSQKFERIEAVFQGAGDTLSAALAALLATGSDVSESTQDALQYLDRCLLAGFSPGMGHNIPDRMFWAQPDDDQEPSSPDLS